MRKVLAGLLAVFVIIVVGLTLNYGALQESPDARQKVIRIGVLPDQNETILRERYAALISFLSEDVGVPFELVVPNDYGELLELFGAGRVDLAFFGGVTFVLANKRYGAVPLVMRDIDVEFRSHFIARTSDRSRTRNIEDFKGATFAFGSPLSTSGHLMPRFFLELEGISAEQFFSSVEYTGAHDKTAERVRDGQVDLGVANSHVIDRMRHSGQLDSRSIEVVWTTPPYANYVWAVRREIDAAVQEEILSSFLSLGSLDDERRHILEGVGATGFLPAVQSDFDELKKVVEEQGML
jgi:phosphonate transport system substrate-binding protein